MKCPMCGDAVRNGKCSFCGYIPTAEDLAAFQAWEDRKAELSGKSVRRTKSAAGQPVPGHKAAGPEAPVPRAAERERPAPGVPARPAQARRDPPRQRSGRPAAGGGGKAAAFAWKIAVALWAMMALAVLGMALAGGMAFP